VYITTADGLDCGHVDLKSRSVFAKQAQFEEALRECLARWCPEGSPQPESSASDPSPPTPPLETSPIAVQQSQASDLPPGDAIPEPAPVVKRVTSDGDSEPFDLVSNVAGSAARAKRDEVNAQAPVLNLVARVLGVKTDERNWRVGARGEEKVANQLAKLGEGWHRIHAVPVGENGSDIDHVVIGPPGVFTLNTKRHPRGKAWIGERAVMVNGQRTDYLRNSRFEARRASALLSTSCEFPVTVKPVIVFVDLEDITVKQMPSDVHVVTRMRLLAWLRSLPPALDHVAVETIFAAARQSITWHPKTK
jgi:hypothetical protein